MRYPTRAGLGGLMITLGAASCGGTDPGGGGPTGPPTTAVASITLDYSTATMALGQKVILQPTLRDRNGNLLAVRPISWSSSAPEVVGVPTQGATGALTALGTGGATVTATVDGASATVAVTVIQLAAVDPGARFTCGLTTDGQAWCAGQGFGPLAVPVATSLRFVSIEVGGQAQDTHACALTAPPQGALYCWGSNGHGQLGVGVVPGGLTPVAVSGGLAFASFSTGSWHTCGVSTDGGAWCWGDGQDGKLGSGNTDAAPVPVPVQVPAGVSFTRISAGAVSTCAIASSGQAWCWGRNHRGQLGSTQVAGGSAQDGSLVPVPVEGAAATVAIVTSGSTSCLVNAGGTVFCWGDNGFGTVGAPTTQVCEGNRACSLVPLQVTLGEPVTHLSSSGVSVCAVGQSGSSWCWGMDLEFLFGNSPSVPPCPALGTLPYGCSGVPVTGVGGLTRLTGGSANQCGIMSDGIARCWGGNTYGQRGWGDALPNGTPQPFSLAPGGEG